MAEEASTMSPGSAEVAHNLAEADHMEGLVQHAAGGEHAEMAALGLNPAAWVSLAMLAFILILVWKKVPGLIGKALDSRIAEIKKQLEEASKLRAEAEALKAEYQKKLEAVASEAETLRGHAAEEAAALIEDAKADAAALVKRREKMAKEKIEAAERAALTEIRARTVAAAATAAANLIAENHDAAADKALVDSTIKAL